MEHALRTVALVAFLTSSSAALQSSADYGDAAYFGTSLAGLGDLDGDGLPELAVGQAYPGVVWILSSATERVHLQLEVPREEGEQASYMPFSQVLAGAGGVDGDGAEDLAVGVPVSSGGAFGHVYVFSGRTGDVLHHLRGPVADDNFGSSLASAGDVNGDGIPDLVVGAPAWKSEGAGSAHVFSGSDGERLFSVEGAGIGDGFGKSVTGGRDVDGDGCPDFAVGAPQLEPPFELPATSTCSRVGAGSACSTCAGAGERSSPIATGTSAAPCSSCRT